MSLQRHLGLRRDKHVQPLLKTIKGRPSREVEDNAPPLSTSSSDEEDEGAGVTGVPGDRSESDEGPSTRGDIARTDFGAGNLAAPQERPGISSTRKNGGRSARASAQGPAYRGRPKRISVDDEIMSGSEEDSRTMKKPRSDESGPGRPVNSTGRADAFTRPMQKDRMQYGRPSGSRPKTDASAASSDTGRRKFKKANEVPVSPEHEKVAPRFSSLKPGLDHTPSPKKSFQMPEVVKSPLEKKSRINRTSKRKQPSREKDATETEESQRPVFFVPVSHGSGAAEDSEPRDDLAELGAVGQDIEDLRHENSDAESKLEEPLVTRCPLCNEPVEQSLLETFKTKSRMTIRQQTQICHLHRTKSAKDTWLAKGYPDIDWYGLDMRMSTHYPLLEDILDGAESHFGNVFIQKVKSGRSRTLLKEEGNLVPGYYGNRGLRVMSEGIVRHFSSKLRDRAVKDRLISARGHTAFVQAVLVPELAVRLIMDDLGLEEQAARSVMQESVWVGELISEDVGEDVRSESDEFNSLSQTVNLSPS